MIIVRTVRRDIANYNRDEELVRTLIQKTYNFILFYSLQEETLEETGWKLVHGDVFRPPPNSMLLVNLVGTGIQLLGMVIVTVCKSLAFQYSLYICFCSVDKLTEIRQPTLPVLVVSDVHRLARKAWGWLIKVDTTGNKLISQSGYFAHSTQIGLSTYFRFYPLLSANLRLSRPPDRPVNITAYSH